MRILGSIFTSIMTLVCLVLAYKGIDWLYYNFDLDWFGYLILFYTLRTRLFTFLFISVYHLRNLEETYTRVMNPTTVYWYSNYDRLDKFKIKVLTEFPYLIKFTDYIHGFHPYTMSEFIDMRDWHKKIWIITTIQLAIGICWINGYYSDWYYEIFVIFGVSSVMGMLIGNIKAWTPVGKLLYKKLHVGYITVFDLFYNLSFGYTSRGYWAPFRFWFSFMILGLSITTYLGLTEIWIYNLKEVGDALWQSLYQWII